MSEKNEIRFARLWLEITDDRAGTVEYSVKPISTSLLPADAAKGYTLKKYDPEGKVDTCYAVQMDGGGRVTCTCKGFESHLHCKHCDVMSAVGLLFPEELLTIHRLRLELQSKLDEAEQNRLARFQHPPQPNPYGKEPDYQPGVQVNYIHPKTNQPVLCKVVKLSEKRAKVVLDGDVLPRWVDRRNLCPF